MISGSPAIPRPLPSHFDAASQEILSFLRDAVPMGLWTVTRVVDDTQIYLSVADSVYGVPAGVSVPWPSTFCKYMLSGRPQIAHNVSAVPEYKAIADADGGRVAAYVGFPLFRSDGALFGTLCAFNPEPLTPDFDQHRAMLDLLARLLSTILDADLERSALARELEIAELRASIDALTGLLNRGAWDRLVAQEEVRLRRFGSACAVVAVDLDGLKAINDTKGHGVGDEHLRQTAAVLTRTVGDGGVVARVGGDEFAILCCGADSSAAENLAGRLTRALDDAGISASIGTAQYVVLEGLTMAWQRADNNMYRNRNARRHRR